MPSVRPLIASVFAGFVLAGFAHLPAAATEVTCAPGSEDVCTAWCDHAGGGMQSNPDGSTTCTVMAAAMERAISVPPRQEALAKLQALFGSTRCLCEKTTYKK